MRRKMTTTIDGDEVRRVPAGIVRINDQIYYRRGRKCGWLKVRSFGRAWINAVDARTGGLRSIRPEEITRVKGPPKDG